MIRIIACTSQNGILGKSGKLALPNYPEDMKHFRTMTVNSTVIMGRNTFQEINCPLPKRQNIVISRLNLNLENVENYPFLKEGIKKSTYDNIWLCGGSSIYEEGMQWAQEIILTIAPDIIDDNGACVRFPWINPKLFSLRSLTPFDGDSELLLATYQRNK